MEEAEQIVKTYNFDKRVENYNNKLKLYTKEELEKKGIYEPKETGKSSGSKSTKGKGKHFSLKKMHIRSVWDHRQHLCLA